MLFVHSEGLNLKQCNYGFVIKYVYALTGWTRFKENLGMMILSLLQNFSNMLHIYSCFCTSMHQYSCYVNVQ